MGNPRDDLPVTVGDHSRRRRRCEAAVIDALISRFQPYYQLADYLAAYTDWMVGLAVGQPSVNLTLVIVAINALESPEH